MNMKESREKLKHENRRVNMWREGEKKIEHVETGIVKKQKKTNVRQESCNENGHVKKESCKK